MTKQDNQPEQEQNLQDLQEELASLRDQLRNIDAFVASLLHDMRAPTGMILGSLELLTNECNEGLTDAQIQLIDIAWRGAQRLIEPQDFFMELLWFMNSKGSDFQLEKVDIASIIDKNQAIVFQSMNSLPPVQGNSSLINRALSNITIALGSRSNEIIDCQANLKNDTVSINLTRLDFTLAKYRWEELNQNTEDKLNQRQYYAITPLDIGKALLEKQGAQVTIEKLGESGITITFSLPIYIEKTPPSK
jgi:K+-sensing histidine kinase KdpD